MKSEIEMYWSPLMEPTCSFVGVASSERRRLPGGMAAEAPSGCSSQSAALG